MRAQVGTGRGAYAADTRWPKLGGLCRLAAGRQDGPRGMSDRV